jgi:rhodanese-related sulfurtransferase
MKTFKSFFYVLFVSVFMLSINSCSKKSETLDWFMLSDYQSFKASWDAAGGEMAQVLDIRSEKEYNEGHIPGAKHYQATAPNTKNNNSALPEFVKSNFDASKQILICGGSDSQLAMITCGRISKIGFIFVMGLDGGFNAWKQGNGPIDVKP